MSGRHIEILLVEDNPGDVRLTEEALKEEHINSNLNVVNDGVEALAFLRREGVYADAPRPNLIFLDLNMPRKSGCEVLAEVKSDKDLRRIPIVVLTTSKSDEDILESYDLHANCYINKPVDFDKFISLIKHIKEFWFSVVSLPNEKGNGK